MQNFFLSILTFPYWWYTIGLNLAWQAGLRQLRFSLYRTGLPMLAQHLREPLYKDYTRSGMIISFLIRIVLILFKSLVFCIQLVFILLLVLLYLAMLPAILVMIAFQLLALR